MDYRICENKIGLEEVLPRFRAKDPISALTHFIAFLLAIPGLSVLLLHGARKGADEISLIGLSVFGLSMIGLYGASAAYHGFLLSSRADRVLKKLDHCMIFVLIAGSYTAVCATALRNSTGLWMFALIWGFALLGIVFKLFFVTCPKWVSSILYIGMGWVCLLAFPQIYRALPFPSFLLLLIGGILYTVGGVIYALKLSFLERHIPGFGAHELFHVFVMAGSFCHFLSLYLLVG